MNGGVVTGGDVRLTIASADIAKVGLTLEIQPSAANRYDGARGKSFRLTFGEDAQELALLQLVVTADGLMIDNHAAFRAHQKGIRVDHKHDLCGIVGLHDIVSRSEDIYPVIDDTPSSLGGGIGYADMLSERLRYSLSTYLDYNRFTET